MIKLIQTKDKTTFAVTSPFMNAYAAGLSIFYKGKIWTIMGVHFYHQMPRALGIQLRHNNEFTWELWDKEELTKPFEKLRKSVFY